VRWTLTVLGLSVLILVGGGFVLLASAGEAVGRKQQEAANRKAERVRQASVLAHAEAGQQASAAEVAAPKRPDGSVYFVKRQAVWLGVAAVFMLVVTFFDYHNWRRYPFLTILLYVIVVGLMVAVLFAAKTKGSHRWLALGPLNLQPSELAKIFLVISVAVFLDWAGWRIEKFFKGSIPAVAIVGVLMALAVLEPDYGTTLIIAATGFTLCLVGGMRILHIFLMGGLGAAGVIAMLVFNKNRMHRLGAWLPSKVMAFFDLPPPTGDDSAAFQLNQALVAINHGSLTGVGYTRSMQKQFYLPESHTDFIFAIGAEELGLVFSLLLLAVFTTLFVCGIRIAHRAPDRLGRLLAYGLSFLMFFQVLFNIGVVTGCLPTKGLALPFISYGGTNLMSSLIAVGMLFNIGRQIELPKPRPRSTISPVFS
jgi:cell division protein FtsW